MDTETTTFKDRSWRKSIAYFLMLRHFTGQPQSSTSHFLLEYQQISKYLNRSGHGLWNVYKALL